MKKFKALYLLLSIAMIIAITAGCASSSTTSSNDSSTGTPAASSTSTPSGDIPASIKIGIPNCTTGPLAGMGEGTPWLEDNFKDYVNNELGGIYIKDYDKKLPIEFVIYDNASSSVNTSDLTTKLITEDEVNLIIANHTPDLVIPISNVAETYEMPTIAFDCPVGPWVGDGKTPHKWTFLAHVETQTYYDAYASIWKSAGYVAGADNATLGLIFANDADGTVLGPTYKAAAEADGYKTLFPGAYTAGTTDFSSLIQEYKKAGIQIIFGTMTNPEFAAFWTQCQQLGYQPPIVVVGKAYMLSSQVDAIGRDLMDGIGNEVWWHKTFPYTSKLTGKTCKDFADYYFKGTGKDAAGPQAAKYASLEVMVDALSRSANLEPETIRAAIAATDIDTIMGHIKYNEQNVAPTVCVGGQWVKNADGTMTQEIVGNGKPDNGIATTAKIKTTGLAWQK